MSKATNRVNSALSRLHLRMEVAETYLCIGRMDGLPVSRSDIAISIIDGADDDHRLT